MLKVEDLPAIVIGWVVGFCSEIAIGDRVDTAMIGATTGVCAFAGFLLISRWSAR